MSNVREKREIRQDAGNGKTRVLKVSIVSLFRPMSSSAEEVHGVKGFQDAEAKGYNAKERNKNWEERRESGPTLGNHAVLGYSCKIEAGSPNLTA